MALDAEAAFSRLDRRWRRHGGAFVRERAPLAKARAQNIEYFERSRAVQEVLLSERMTTAA